MTTDNFDERAEKARSRANHPAGRACPSRVGDEAEAYLAALAIGEQPHGDAPAEPRVDLAEHRRRVAQARQRRSEDEEGARRIAEVKQTPLARLFFWVSLICGLIALPGLMQSIIGAQPPEGQTVLFSIIALICWVGRRMLILVKARPIDPTEGGMKHA